MAVSNPARWFTRSSASGRYCAALSLVKPGATHGSRQGWKYDRKLISAGPWQTLAWPPQYHKKRAITAVRTSQLVLPSVYKITANTSLMSARPSSANHHERE